MNKTKNALLSCALLLAAAPAFATLVTLDFEDAPHGTVASVEAVGDRYKDLGIVFLDNAYIAGSQGAYSASTAYGKFYGDDKSSGFGVNKGAISLMSALGTPQVAQSFIIQVGQGFSGDVSMIFAGRGSVSLTALNKDDTIIVGADGKTPLSTGDVSAASQTACVAGFSCNWTSLDLDLGSTEAFGLLVTGSAAQQWFDDLRFADVLAPTIPASGVPEPSGVALSVAALGALAWTRKRAADKRR